MRILLDTHAIVWWLEGNTRLSSRVRTMIEKPSGDIFVSAASAWEIATKVRLKKLPGMLPYVGRLAEVFQTQGFVGLPVSTRHADHAGTLPGPHRDPFDRMLIAQAQLESIALVSNEKVFDIYGVKRLW